MKTKLYSGTSYWLSRAGHYNFYYQYGSPLKLENTIMGEKLLWLSDNQQYLAYRIEPNDIPNFQSKINVIWIKNEE